MPTEGLSLGEEVGDCNGGDELEARALHFDLGGGLGRYAVAALEGGGDFELVGLEFGLSFRIDSGTESIRPMHQ